MMNTIRSKLSNVLSLLREHVTESERQMSILRNEIFNIKSHVSLHSKSVSQRVETVDNKTKNMENIILNSMQTIQNCLQAINDKMTQPDRVKRLQA